MPGKMDGDTKLSLRWAGKVASSLGHSHQSLRMRDSSVEYSPCNRLRDAVGYTGASALVSAYLLKMVVFSMPAGLLLGTGSRRRRLLGSRRSPVSRGYADGAGLDHLNERRRVRRFLPVGRQPVSASSPRPSPADSRRTRRRTTARVRARLGGKLRGLRRLAVATSAGFWLYTRDLETRASADAS